MVWDITTPPDTEAIRQGASRIRELKIDIQTALQVEGIFPGVTPAAPIFRYKPPTGNTASRPTTDPLQIGRLYVNTQTGTIQRDNGAGWDDITGGVGIASGVVMPFFQAAAPVGWTQIVTYNDRALRVVSGAGGGTGGTDPVSAPSATSHTHTDAGHTHSIPSVTLTLDSGNANAGLAGSKILVDGSGNLVQNTGGGGSTGVKNTGTTASGTTGSGTASINSANVTPNSLQYIDVLICSKN